MGEYLFLGLSINIELTADDHRDLDYLNISGVKAADGKWYLYAKNKIYQATDLQEKDLHRIRLESYDYQRYLNQLKRVKDHIYAAYNNDFKIHEIVIT